MSLIEVLVALSLLAIALTTIVPAFTSYLRINGDSEVRGSAVYAAQQVMDGLRARDFTTWPASGDTETVHVGGRELQVDVTHAAYCDGGSCSSDARRVSLEVRHDGRTFYTVETVFTRFNTGNGL